MKQTSIRIGTSGWSYDYWRGSFYPETVPSNQMLAYYVQKFNSVEINNSFYHLPSETAIDQWREAAPSDFLFSAKASRYVTHMKKLKEPHEGMLRFMKRMSVLGDRLGPILFQLPPRWSFNEARFEEFLRSLSRDYDYAFEFRDQSWLNPRCYDLLSTHDAAFCIYDLNGFLSPKEVTANFVYIRLHGPDGAYQGSYDDHTLSDWAHSISRWRREGRRVFCYFDNDQSGFAAQNALRLQSMLEKLSKYAGHPTNTGSPYDHAAS